MALFVLKSLTFISCRGRARGLPSRLFLFCFVGSVKVFTRADLKKFTFMSTLKTKKSEIKNENKMIQQQPGQERQQQHNNNNIMLHTCQ